MLSRMPGTDEPSARVDLGMVCLEAAPGWRFYPIGDRIVGRPASGVGVVQIKILSEGTLAPNASHEQGMAAAVAASAYQDLEKPGVDRAQQADGPCLAGGESYRFGRDFVRVWYRRCPGGAVAAWFACRANRAREADVVQSIRDCDHMLATVELTPPVA
jgi:hypothetical protein